MKIRKLFFLCLFITAVAVFSAVVMLLWNWLMPILFHLQTISFLQALGLLVLSRLLFGGHGFNRRHRPMMMAGFREKWMNLSAEEKENLRIKWNQRCGQ